MKEIKEILLSYQMLNSPAFIGLSASAKVLYNYMLLAANGCIQFNYPITLAADIMTRVTFIKARDELVAKGFINYDNMIAAKRKCEMAEYSFSDRWKR